MRARPLYDALWVAILGLALVACSDDGLPSGGADGVDADVLFVAPDTSTPPPDTQQPPQDTQQPPQDTQQPPADTQQPPTDTQEPPADTQQPPADTLQPPTDTQQPGCGALTLSGPLAQVEDFAQYEAVGDFGFGGPGLDVVSLEFYTSETGTFDLGSSINANYGTCDQCVIVYADVDLDAGTVGSVYFQTGGTLVVSPSTPPGSATFNATLSGLSFVEVTIDSASFASTPVPGGACRQGAGPFTLATATCVPDCAGKICGPDSCGGVCSPGCATGACDPTGTACVDASVCGGYALSGALAQFEDSPAYGLVGDFGFGGAAPDLVVFELYTAATGNFDLASSVNANYESCEQCVMVYADVDVVAETYSALYFQTAGTLAVNVAPGGAEMALTLSGAHFAEATIDGDTFVSSLVPGGACYQAPGPFALATTTCVPDCAGKICGSDGCGGTCLPGCASGTCNAAGTACGTECGAISLAGELDHVAGTRFYELTGDFGFGGPAADLVSIEFFTDAAGNFALGTGDNANYATCEQCVVVFADFDPEAQTTTGIYFATAGTLAVAPGGVPGDSELELTLLGLAFEQVTILGEAPYTSTPVPGGACHEGAGPFTLATGPCVPSCAGRVCGPDSCGGTCAPGCTTGTCNLTGDLCQATPTCAPLTLGGPVGVLAGDDTIAVDITSSGLGAVARFDLFWLEFWSATTGSFELATGVNANYRTCEQCMVVGVDIDSETPRFFYPSAGTMTVAPGSDYTEGPFSATFSGVLLTEVTFDGDMNSIAVPGGACIDLVVSPALSLAP